MKHKPCYSSIPNSWNMTRSLKFLIQVQEQYSVLDSMMYKLRHALIEEIPDFSRHLCYDSKDLESYFTGEVGRKTGQVSDADADWGKKEYHGLDQKSGKPWSKVKSWFGYGLYLIADKRYSTNLTAKQLIY